MTKENNGKELNLPDKIQYVKTILSLLNKDKIVKAVNILKKQGVGHLLGKIRHTVHKEVLIERKYKFTAISDMEYDYQKSYKFDNEPLISIVVPAYKTPLNLLDKMILSVMEQSYSKWELCIADGSESPDVANHIRKVYSDEKRIKVKTIATNKGISGNSNEALAMASGEYISLLDHDDVLTKDALYEVVKVINTVSDVDFIYSDEDKTDIDGLSFFEPAFKPDFAPDFLRTNNYICHFTTIKKSLLEKVGNYFISEYDGAQDYDLFLRCTEQATSIVHIPKVLYHWRVHKGSTAANTSSKPYTHIAGKKALEAHLQRINRRGLVSECTSGSYDNTFKINYELINRPLVSIIIPNYNHKDDLQKCITSIFKSSYTNYEILIVENNSTDQALFDYYDDLKTKDCVKVLYWKHEFNYAAINNWAAQQAKGEVFVFMNNDIEIINSDWIEEMLSFTQFSEVGAVGAKLYYPDNTIQHGGIIVGVEGVAGHSFRFADKYSEGYMKRLVTVQNLSAVTAALMMIQKSTFDKLKGFDERFKVAFNDVDLCMRLRENSYSIIYTPYATAYHFESKSRGYEDTPEKIQRFNTEINLFHTIWEGIFKIRFIM